jgi:hypothetical protein
MCGYFHDRASCTNSLRRPVAEADSGCIEWIRKNVLQEEVVLEILREVRQRISQQCGESVGEVEALEIQIAKLRKEIANLAEAVALTGGSVDALAQKLSQRQERLSGMEARLKMIKVAPDVLKLEVRRLEAEVRHRIDHFRELLDGDPEEARKVVEALLDGPATFTPIETPDGKRYKVEGRIATGALLQALPSPQRACPQGDSNCKFRHLRKINRDACLTAKRSICLSKFESLWCPSFPSRSPQNPGGMAAIGQRAFNVIDGVHRSPRS